MTTSLVSEDSVVAPESRPRQPVFVFVASPSDVSREREVVREAIGIANRILANDLGIHLELDRWEDTRPGRGRPQGQINPLIRRCQLFIAVFHKRWGTPTGDYSSGTEEEIDVARELAESAGGCPEMWIYFKEIDPTDLEDPDDQARQVISFRNKIEADQSYKYGTFHSIDEWKVELVVFFCDWVKSFASVEFRFTSAIRSQSHPPATSNVNFGIQNFGTITIVGNTLSISDVGADSSSASPDESALDEEFDAAIQLIKEGKEEVARDRLERIRNSKVGSLSARENYRIFAYIGFTYLGSEDRHTASTYFNSASQYLPSDEGARSLAALAQDLQGNKSRAFEMAGAIIDEFPLNARAHAIRVTNAPLEESFESIESLVPLELHLDIEVATSLAQRAIHSGEFDRAVYYSRRAIEADPERFETYSLHASSLLGLERAEGTLVWGVGVVPSSEENISEAISQLNRAIELARQQGRSQAVARLMANRGVARRFLKDEDGAKTDIETAYAADPNDIDVKFQYATLSYEQEEFDEAIKLIEEIRNEDHSLMVDLVWVAWTRRRARAEDLAAAVTWLRANLETFSLESSDWRHDAIHLLIGIQVDLGQFQDALDTLDSLPDEFIGRVGKLTSQSFVLARQNSLDEARNKAYEALNLVDGETPLDERRGLAMLFQTLELPSHALALWKDLITPTYIGDDTFRLLACASITADDGFLLQFCRALRANGLYDERTIEYELMQLVKYNSYGDGIELLQEAQRQLPQSKLLRLDLSSLAIECGRPELIDTDPSHVPSPSEIEPRLAVRVVHVLKHDRDPLVAVRYAYEMLRFGNNYNVAEAHLALATAMLPIDGRHVSIEDPTVVGAGTAIELQESGTATSRWVVIEDEFEPRLELEEVAVDHPLANALIGLTVMDSYSYQLEQGGRVSGQVLRIASKYNFRTRRWLEKFDQWFPRQQFIRKFTVPRMENGELDVEAAQAQLRQVTGDVPTRLAKALDQYQSSFMPMYLIAAAARITSFEATQYLIAHEAIELRCCEGTQGELEKASALLTDLSRIVLDASALATLAMLRIHINLDELPFTPVITSGTHRELMALSVVNDSEPTWNSISNSFREWISSKCEVESGTALANLPADQREFLTDLLGQATSEAIAVAAMLQIPLWTDDHFVATLAAQELAVERLWTRVVLVQLVRSQAMGLDIGCSAVADLMSKGYVFTFLDAELFHQAAIQSSWNPDVHPFSTLLGHLGSPRVRAEGIQKLAGLILRAAWRDSSIFLLQRQNVALRVLSRISVHQEGYKIINWLLSNAQGIFGDVHIVAQNQFSEIARAWRETNRRRQ